MPKPSPDPSRVPGKPAKAKSAQSDDGAVVRVLCVDDHPVLIEGLEAQFALTNAICAVGSLPSADRLLEEVERLKPDVVLLDIEMPGADAFEATDRLRHIHPRVRVIVLSAHIRDGYIAAAFKCGAWGYFAKSDELEAIMAGICEVARSAAGTFAMGPRVKERCAPLSGVNRAGIAPAPAARRAHKSVDPARTRLDGLTAREVEVLRLIGKGLSRTQIATELSRSPKTIDGHQDRIRKKLRIESRSDLMRFAIREGLAEA